MHRRCHLLLRRHLASARLLLGPVTRLLPSHRAWQPPVTTVEPWPEQIVQHLLPPSQLLASFSTPSPASYSSPAVAARHCHQAQASHPPTSALQMFSVRLQQEASVPPLLDPLPAQPLSSRPAWPSPMLGKLLSAMPCQHLGFSFATPSPAFCSGPVGSHHCQVVASSPLQGLSARLLLASLVPPLLEPLEQPLVSCRLNSCQLS